MFLLGNIIPEKKKPVNRYKLVIENMSGDADAYEKTVTFFKKENEDILTEIIELCFWSGKAWPDRDEIEERYKKIKKKFNDFKDIEFENPNKGILTRDVYSDGECICRPSLISLTWFDEDGVEYEAKKV